MASIALWHQFRCRIDCTVAQIMLWHRLRYESGDDRIARPKASERKHGIVDPADSPLPLILKFQFPTRVKHSSFKFSVLAFMNFFIFFSQLARASSKFLCLSYFLSPLILREFWWHSSEHWGGGWKLQSISYWMVTFFVGDLIDNDMVGVILAAHSVLQSFSSSICD